MIFLSLSGKQILPAAILETPVLSRVPMEILVQLLDSGAVEPGVCFHLDYDRLREVFFEIVRACNMRS